LAREKFGKKIRDISPFNDNDKILGAISPPVNDLFAAPPWRAREHADET